MKVKIVRGYDMGVFSREVEKMYEEYNVDRVDTHTEVCSLHQQDTIYYIAIIFFHEK